MNYSQRADPSGLKPLLLCTLAGTTGTIAFALKGRGWKVCATTLSSLRDSHAFQLYPALTRWAKLCRSLRLRSGQALRSWIFDCAFPPTLHETRFSRTLAAAPKQKQRTYGTARRPGPFKACRISEFSRPVEVVPFPVSTFRLLLFRTTTLILFRRTTLTQIVTKHDPTSAVRISC
jgi:hypothetical protein